MIQPEWKEDWEAMLAEFLQNVRVRTGQLLLFGVSTSEVLGKKIGTAGDDEVAAMLFETIWRRREEYGFYPVFQCCEHLNRALVIEEDAARRYSFEEVSAVPVPKAGGAMASYAYRHMERPVLVEEVRAHAGIDVGDTLIGMHLKPVAVPYRPRRNRLGFAHVTMAYTRPKLIGGARAVYRNDVPCT